MAEVRSWRVSNGLVSLALRSVGGGPERAVVVLVHGGPSLSHHYMEGLELLASDRLQVVSYDQRGTGDSGEDPAGGVGLEQQVADLEAIRTRLGRDRVHLLGHSWGGLVAMAYAAAHASRLASLILVDSIPPTSEGLQAAHRRFLARQRELVRQGVVARRLPAVTGDDCRPRFLSLLPVYFADPARPATDEILRTSCRERVGQRIWDATLPYDLREGLCRLALPCLILQGSRDPFGLDMVQEIRLALGGSNPQVSILPECGHFPWIERPDLFFPLVGDWLARLA